LSKFSFEIRFFSASPIEFNNYVKFMVWEMVFSRTFTPTFQSAPLFCTDCFNKFVNRNFNDHSKLYWKCIRQTKWVYRFMNETRIVIGVYILWSKVIIYHRKRNFKAFVNDHVITIKSIYIIKYIINNCLE